MRELTLPTPTDPLRPIVFEAGMLVAPIQSLMGNSLDGSFAALACQIPGGNLVQVVLTAKVEAGLTKQSCQLQLLAPRFQEGKLTSDSLAHRQRRLLKKLAASASETPPCKISTDQAVLQTLASGLDTQAFQNAWDQWASTAPPTLSKDCLRPEALRTLDSLAHFAAVAIWENSGTALSPVGNETLLEALRDRDQIPGPEISVRARDTVGRFLCLICEALPEGPGELAYLLEQQIELATDDLSYRLTLLFCDLLRRTPASAVETHQATIDKVFRTCLTSSDRNTAVNLPFSGALPVRYPLAHMLGDLMAVMAPDVVRWVRSRH